MRKFSATITLFCDIRGPSDDDSSELEAEVLFPRKEQLIRSNRKLAPSALVSGRLIIVFIISNIITGLEETKAIVNSNSRAIQAMMEQQTTNRLKHQEAMDEMRALRARVAETQSGLTRILINHDEDRPTILRRLMTIENKVEQILEQN